MTPTKNKPHPFAHPIEEEFAKILDFYGIEWKYEPRTFPLEHDPQGNVTEAFTPDFYLPQQNLYVELTTMQTRLANIKNRKIRRMKEIYPDVNVKLFKRREMNSLMNKYGLQKPAETGESAA